jgi:Imm-5 like putative immunity protein
MAKRKMVTTVLDNKIAEHAAQADHKTLAKWACDCVERVLPYSEQQFPEDERPRLAIQAARQWVIGGVFRMADVRRAALAAHKAASEVKDNDAARSAARAAGQAIATAHVPGHAVAAAIYAATAVRDGTQNIDVDAAVTKECEWQYQHLLDLINQSDDL